MRASKILPLCPLYLKKSKTKLDNFNTKGKKVYKRKACEMPTVGLFIWVCLWVKNLKRKLRQLFPVASRKINISDCASRFTVLLHVY